MGADWLSTREAKKATTVFPLPGSQGVGGDAGFEHQVSGAEGDTNSGVSDLKEQAHKLPHWAHHSG